MTTSTSNPTVRRLELAAQLRRLRLDAGKSVEEAAAELMCSPAKISRMETGGRGVQARDIRDLARLYAVSDQVLVELQQAALDAKKPGWWQDFRAIGEQVATFLALEDACTQLLSFDALRIFGLFQNADFTASLLPGLRPPEELTEQWIDDVIAIRVKRQERVRSGEIQIHAILDEAALRRPVGTPQVWQSQIERLITEADRPNVTLQIVPFSRGTYPGVDGSFQHMTLSGELSDVVFVEGLLGNFIVDQKKEVDRYRSIFDYISRKYALPADASKEWLAQLRKDLAKDGPS